MYLDDIIIVSTDHMSALHDFQAARALLSDLGLPEAADKAQPPSKQVRWLGIDIDCEQMILSLPTDKVIEVKECVYKSLKCKSLSKCHMQSLLGKLVHVGKCVHPARLFISRLLQSLRGMTRNFIKISHDMRLDLVWFREFMETWNGVSLIPAPTPTRTLYVDASGSGIGGTDGASAYGGQITPVSDPVCNIAELEAANVVVAAHTFFSQRDKGAHFLIFCDNEACVKVFQTGRGRNSVILESARALWMVQALLDIRITYSHISGIDNKLADALSRMHMSDVSKSYAIESLTRHNIVYVNPVLHVFNNFAPPIFSRGGVTVAPGSCCDAPIYI